MRLLVPIFLLILLRNLEQKIGIKLPKIDKKLVRKLVAHLEAKNSAFWLNFLDVEPIFEDFGGAWGGAWGAFFAFFGGQKMKQNLRGFLRGYKRTPRGGGDDSGCCLSSPFRGLVGMPLGYGIGEEREI